MDSTWTSVFVFWFAVVFPLGMALALHKVRTWLDGPEHTLGCPDPVMQNMHNESQHAQVICSIDNTVSKAHTDHSLITQGAQHV